MVVGCTCQGERPLCRICIDKEIGKIHLASHHDLAVAWRFFASGHPWFSNMELYAAFKKRFDAFGGMTPQMSREIGFAR